MKKLLRDFARSTDGAVLPFVGLAFLTLVAVVGLAVDYGRAQMVQTKLHASLDAAALAAASVAQSRDPETEVLKFVEANFPQGYMGARARPNTSYPDSYVTVINVTRNPQTSLVTIAVEGAAEVDTLFMRIFGHYNVPVAAETVVSQTRRRGFEMVMVLDSTGSMGGVQGGISRRNAMVNAANELLDTLYGTQDSFDNMFIGLVPFSSQVHVGAAKRTTSNWKRANATATASIAGTVGCVDDGPEDRNVTYATTDTPPTNGDSLFVSGAVTPTCSTPQMTPLQSSRARVRTALSQINANGNTRIDLGAAWGWRMLSPFWTGRWNHVSTALPLPYNTPDMDKVMILLTDGENNPVGGTISRATADTRLSTICQNMKTQGVIVYSITFHTNDMGVRNLMRACASSSDHYFHASGNDSIGQVFRQIADSLLNLRISK